MVACFGLDAVLLTKSCLVRLCALLLFNYSSDHISGFGIRDWSSCGGLHRRLLLGLVITQDLHSSNQLVLLLQKLV